MGTAGIEWSDVVGRKTDALQNRTKRGSIEMIDSFRRALVVYWRLTMTISIIVVHEAAQHVLYKRCNG